MFLTQSSDQVMLLPGAYEQKSQDLLFNRESI
jgi:hypothetical protein